MPIDVSNTSRIISRATVSHQGEVFTFVPVTGALTFDVDPFMLRPGPPSGPGFDRPSFLGDSPFNLTGQLSFEGRTVALEGSGILHVTALASPGSAPFAEFRDASYDLTPIPEPATLALWGAAAAVGGLYGLRRRLHRRSQ
jgi:hypothetical protein